MKKLIGEVSEDTIYIRGSTICKCGGDMKRRVCTTDKCIVYECQVCGRRGHYQGGGRPKECTARYG